MIIATADFTKGRRCSQPFIKINFSVRSPIFFCMDLCVTTLKVNAEIWSFGI